MKKQPYQTNYIQKPAKETSLIGVFAFVFSLFPIAHLLGFLLALIDVIFRHKKRRCGFACAAIIISLLWTLLLGYLFHPLISLFWDVNKASKESAAEISFTSSELVQNGYDDIFYVQDRIKSINGRFNLEEKPKTITYKLYAGENYELISGELKYGKKFKINCGGLAPGYNYLDFILEYDDVSQNEQYMYILYNMNSENVKALGLDSLDSDGDGLFDAFELENSETDSYIKDSDGNAVTDDKEDPDADGLNNLQEQRLGTLCFAYDTDADGISDMQEQQYGTNPLVSDSDGDGMTDGFELEQGLPANSTNKGEIITYKEEKCLRTGMNVDISVNGEAQYIESFRMFEVPSSYTLSSQNVSGMIGSAMCFVMDEQPESAQIEITLDCNEYEEGKSYFLYYVDEEKMELQRVGDQEQHDNVITATLFHFSKYLVSSSENPYIKSMNIDSVDGEEGLYLNYEDYLKDMYGDQAVLSYIVLSPNTKSNDSLNWYWEFDEMLPELSKNTGHTLFGYFYDGSDVNLSLKVLDDEAEGSLGKFGFGGWLHSGKATWGFSVDGEIKYPTGYYSLYKKGITDEFGNIVYRSEKKKYDDDMKPEKNGNIMLPIVINDEQLDRLNSFLLSYNSQYQLGKNNCTTFVRDAFNAAGVKNEVNISYVPSYEDDPNHFDASFISNGVIGAAGSPGQAAYSIQKEYPYEHVYRLKEEKDGEFIYYFTSKMAQECAIQRRQEQEQAQREEELKLLAEREKLNQSVSRLREVMDHQTKCGFIVLHSPIGQYMGIPVLIVQECDTINFENQKLINEWLNTCQMGAIDHNVKYKYIQVPVGVMQMLVNKHIPEKYRFYSGEVEVKKALNGSFEDGLRWALLYNYYYIERTPYDFFIKGDLFIH